MTEKEDLYPDLIELIIMMNTWGCERINLLKQYEGPRTEYFVKQGQVGKGENEADEDSGKGNKVKKDKKKNK